MFRIASISLRTLAKANLVSVIFSFCKLLCNDIDGGGILSLSLIMTAAQHRRPSVRVAFSHTPTPSRKHPSRMTSQEDPWLMSGWIIQAGSK